MARTHQLYADELLANSLAVGQTVVAAARAAGISERTAYRRMKNPAVRTRIAEVRRAALDTASGKLHQGMVSASDRLPQLLGHDNPNVQIRACQTIIQMALKVRQEVDVADRLDQLGEQPRQPQVMTAFAGGPHPVAIGPDQNPADPPRPPDCPAPGDTVSPPTGTGLFPVGPELARTPNENDRGVEPDSPPAEGHPAGTPGVGRERPNLPLRAGAIVAILLLLFGVSLAFAGAAWAGTGRVPTTNASSQTCQNLTEPATAGVSRTGQATGPDRPRSCRADLTDCFSLQLPRLAAAQPALPRSCFVEMPCAGGRAECPGPSRWVPETRPARQQASQETSQPRIRTVIHSPGTTKFS